MVAVQVWYFCLVVYVRKVTKIYGELMCGVCGVWVVPMSGR